MVMLTPSEDCSESACVGALNIPSSSGTVSTVASLSGSSFSWQHHPHPQVNEEDLWKPAFLVDVPDRADVKIQWCELKEKKFVVYARAVSDSGTAGTFVQEQSHPQSLSSISIGKVVQAMVDETWKRTAKAILEKKKRFPNDAFPPTKQLLELGSVWLINEESFCRGQRARAHRLHLEDETRCPDWANSMLRIHTWPERHYAANWVDWGKFCKGIWLNGEVSVSIAGVEPHIPTQSEGVLPYDKDGAIVYEVRCGRRCCYCEDSAPLRFSNRFANNSN